MLFGDGDNLTGTLVAAAWYVGSCCLAAGDWA